jgi:hypothetical protein
MRKKRIVEGLTLDLTLIPESGIFEIDDLIVQEISKPTEEKQDHCDVCKSFVVGAFRECAGKAMCGLCCAIFKEKVNNDVIDILKQEYAKPCSFCGDMTRQKHFDHINMFSKTDSIGLMVEMGKNSDDILEEIKKCQILCIACHKKVTYYEKKYGFIQKKRGLNQQIRLGRDMNDIKMALFKEYSEKMGPFYESMVADNGKIGVGGI